MALYGKKLHIRKDNVVTDINLWTEKSEVGTPALAIRHDGKVVYAKLGNVDNTLASALRVRKDNVVYAALKNRWVMINIVQSANQTITVTADGAPHTESFSIPYGTAYTATITAAAGFTPGALSSTDGTAEGDVTISATAAVTTVPTGSVSGSGQMDFTIPNGITVVRFFIKGQYAYYVGVTPGGTYRFGANFIEDDSGDHGEEYVIYSFSTKRTLVLLDAEVQNPTSNIPLRFIISYRPEINAHGPTNGSI